MKVLSIDVIKGGKGYTSPPTIEVVGGGAKVTPATATAEITGDKVSKVNVLTPGDGYEKRPDVRATGGGGRGADLRATVG